MGQDRTLARGGRISGALVLAVLTLFSLGWIIWDFVEAGRVTDVWSMWQGSRPRASNGQWATTWMEPALLVIYPVCAVTALRSTSAAGILGSAGVLTVVLRLPGLWTLNADWIKSQDEGLKGMALFSVIAMLLLGVALVVVAVAGRRPVAAEQPYAQGAFGTPQGAPQVPAGMEAGPAHPVRGGAILAFATLVLLSFVIIAWDVYALLELEWETYSRGFTGGPGMTSLFEVPASWWGAGLVLMALTAAFAALADAPLSRPLGMIAAAPMIAQGFLYLTGAVPHLGGFGYMDTPLQLMIVTMLLQLVGGIAVIGGLSRRDDGESYYEPEAPAWAPAWGQTAPGPVPGGMPGPAPGHGPPPAWGSGPAGGPPGYAPPPRYAPPQGPFQGGPGVPPPPPGPPADGAPPAGAFGPPPPDEPGFGPAAPPPPPGPPPAGS